MRALAVAIAALAGAAGCGQEPEPLLAATCGPNTQQDGVTCTVTNHGKRASRACLRARIQPEAGLELITRRVCTEVIAPGGAAVAEPRLEKLGNRSAVELLTGQCLTAHGWTCKVSAVESSREMAEDHPKEP